MRIKKRCEVCGKLYEIDRFDELCSQSHVSFGFVEKKEDRSVYIGEHYNACRDCAKKTCEFVHKLLCDEEK